MLNELILSSPGRVFVSINGFDIYNYGVIMALALLAGTLVSNYIADKADRFFKGIFIDIAPFLVISGIIGARLWYCLINYEQYVLFPFEILNLRTGGMSIHGAILGGFIALLVYAKIKNISIISLCDYASPGLILGQAIGRWGNFFNNEAFGIPYDGFLKLYIPPAMRPYGFTENSFFHPAFLYESLADLILFVVLFYVLTVKTNMKPGTSALIYLTGYSFIRFFVELIRIDSTLSIICLPFPAFVSLIIFTISIIIFISNLTKVYK